jgi:hypothetical protein
MHLMNHWPITSMVLLALGVYQVHKWLEELIHPLKLLHLPMCH